jgi:hypothetical protein
MVALGTACAGAVVALASLHPYLSAAFGSAESAPAEVISYHQLRSYRIALRTRDTRGRDAAPGLVRVTRQIMSPDCLRWCCMSMSLTAIKPPISMDTDGSKTDIERSRTP